MSTLDMVQAKNNQPGEKAFMQKINTWQCELGI